MGLSPPPPLPACVCGRGAAVGRAARRGRDVAGAAWAAGRRVSAGGGPSLGGGGTRRDPSATPSLPKNPPETPQNPLLAALPRVAGGTPAGCGAPSLCGAFCCFAPTTIFAAPPSPPPSAGASSPSLPSFFLPFAPFLGGYRRGEGGLNARTGLGNAAKVQRVTGVGRARQPGFCPRAVDFAKSWRRVGPLEQSGAIRSLP